MAAGTRGRWTCLRVPCFGVLEVEELGQAHSETHHTHTEGIAPPRILGQGFWETSCHKRKKIKKKEVPNVTLHDCVLASKPVPATISPSHAPLLLPPLCQIA